MSINVSKAIEGNFYPFTETLQLRADLLQGRLASFITPCVVVGRYASVGSNVYLDASLEVTAEFQCDNCLDKVTRQLKTSVGATYYLEGSGEDGDYSYKNFIVDITDAVSEEIVLALPMRVLCRDDCRGICPVCGVDLNKGSCDCLASQDNACDQARNPFSQLKNFNNFSGGASNGSTKA